jgi:carboxymethylenebutenolidase
MKRLTQDFANDGYLSVSPELYHRTAAPGFTLSYTDFQTQALPHFSAMTPEGMIHDVQGCYDWLKSEDQQLPVAAIGYCMGGRVAYIANSSVNLSCAISYYGGRIVPAHLDLAEKQKSPILFIWGGLDKGIPTEQIQSLNKAMTAAQKNFICLEFSKADHGFSCDERPSFNKIATEQAHAITSQFLNDYNRAL